MLIVLSQKIDVESSYEDSLYASYHYPARYRNQLHEGDTFVYYQGNRFNKAHRYYFGTGKIGRITPGNEDDYYAELLDCRTFPAKVPIYLPDGGYIEQLGYETVRKSLNPPWQSSVRPISEEAFLYILEKSGLELESQPSVDELKEKLKHAVREFFVEDSTKALNEISAVSCVLAEKLAQE